MKRKGNGERKRRPRNNARKRPKRGNTIIELIDDAIL